MSAWPVFKVSLMMVHHCLLLDRLPLNDAISESWDFRWDNLFGMAIEVSVESHSVMEHIDAKAGSHSSSAILHCSIPPSFRFYQENVVGLKNKTTKHGLYELKPINVRGLSEMFNLRFECNMKS